MFAGQAQQQGETVMLQGAVHEPGFELGRVPGRGLTEAEVTPDQSEVLCPRLAPPAVPLQLVRGDVELPRPRRRRPPRGRCSGRRGRSPGSGARRVGGRTPGGWRPRSVRGIWAAVGAGEGEVGVEVAGDDLGWEAVEPLAFRVAEEPDGHGGLLRGRPPGVLANEGFREDPGDAATATPNPGFSILENPSRNGFLGIVRLRWVSRKPGGGTAC